MHDITTMLTFDPTKPGDYSVLKNKLDEVENTQELCMNRLFYLSIPPSVYTDVVTNLGEAKLAENCQHGTGTSSLLVEKPFGYDIKTAEDLIAHTAKYFDEAQIYRIDHYLAKETAQNILTFRSHNPLFFDVWNSEHIRSIDVIAHEKLGVEGRGGFYDDTGALRDLIQSHLMQLLALTTMELPTEYGETSLHASKQDLLNSIEPVPTSEVSARTKRGQYKGYKGEAGKPESTTETYAEVKLRIPTERWKGTEFTLSTGKAMASKLTIVRVRFQALTDATNELTFRLQPNEGIDVTLQVKKPGFEYETEAVALDFEHKAAAHPDAYEHVLIQAIKGDHQLFASSEEVMASWRALQPVIDAWRASSDDLIEYDKGSLGIA
jgi:glucose-6-phosphate 1-dehydrogenase